MKKIILLLPLLFISFFGFGQGVKDIDSTAIFILDKMSIANREQMQLLLNSFSDNIMDNLPM